jgi:hypothetical protein
MGRMKFRISLITSACILVIATGAIGPVRQFAKSEPIHRWEGAHLVEAYRVSRSLPVYEDAATGHATHMYGPLTSWVVGLLMKITGPSFQVARILSFASFLLAATLVVLLFRQRAAPLSVLIASSVLWASGRTVVDFVEPRPDGISLLLMVLAVTALFRGWKEQNFLWHSAGLAFLLSSFFFKQTGAMVCAVPVFAALISGKREMTAKRAVMIATPFIAVASAVALLYVRWPLVYHFAVDVPKQYPIYYGKMMRMGLRPLLGMPILWLAPALAWAEGRGRWPVDKDRLKTAWILAAVFVSIGAGAFGAAKQGGRESLLEPAVFALTALFLHAAAPLEKALAAVGPRSGRSGRWEIITTALLLVTVFHFHFIDQNGTAVSFGDRRYEKVVEICRKLEGRTVCPQDPSIPVFAQGEVGRSLTLEHDAAGWPSAMPDYAYDDIDGAEYVVTIGRGSAFYDWPLPVGEKEQVLGERGFSKVAIPALEESVYRLWRRRPTER